MYACYVLDIRVQMDRRLKAAIFQLRSEVISDMTDMTPKMYYVFPVLENYLQEAETFKQFRSMLVVVFDLILSIKR